MKKLKSFLIFLVLFLQVINTNALVIYVSSLGTGQGLKSSPASLQTALDMARSNGLDDTLLLSQGTYTRSGGFVYDSSNNDGKNVLLMGGWSENYSSFSDDPSKTILDGTSSNRILYIGANKPGLNFRFWVERVTFKNGYSTTDHGAAIRVYEGVSSGSDTGKVRVYFDRCDFINNQALNNSSGGALFIYSYFELRRCYFESNRAYNGGAIYCAPGSDGDQSISPLISECYFVDNTNYGNQGSSIWHNVQLRISQCYIHGRSDGVSSVGPGSAVWGNSGSFTKVYDTEFKGIHCPYWGSALQSFDGSLEVVNCLFVENSSGNSSGYAALAYYNNSGSAARSIDISNCTFADNISKSGFYGAVHLRLDANDKAEIINTIFWDCGTYPIYRQNLGAGTVSYSDVQGGLVSSNFFDGGNNIAMNPLFSGAGEYTLSSNSPCINAGNNNAILITEEDLDGRVRILNDTVDMGANEFNRAPTDIELSSDQVEENVPEFTLIGQLTATDPDKGDKHHFELSTGALDNDLFSIDSGKLYLNISPDHESRDAYSIRVRVYDSGQENVEKDFEIRILDVNEAPMVVDTIPDKQGVAGVLLDFALTSGSFSDPDNDALTLTALLSDGNQLPGWLSFDHGSRRFYGTPDKAQALEIVVLASDGEYTVADTFLIEIEKGAGIYDLEEQISVYPNPFHSGNLQVETWIGHPMAMKLYNSTGQFVDVYQLISGNVEIGILSPGLYFLEIIHGDQIFRTILIVE